MRSQVSARFDENGATTSRFSGVPLLTVVSVSQSQRAAYRDRRKRRRRGLFSEDRLAGPMAHTDGSKPAVSSSIRTGLPLTSAYAAGSDRENPMHQFLINNREDLIARCKAKARSARYVLPPINSWSTGFPYSWTNSHAPWQLKRRASLLKEHGFPEHPAATASCFPRSG
jgi:hypothetical protein